VQHKQILLHFFLDLKGFLNFNDNKMHGRNAKGGIGMEIVDPIYDVKDIERMRKAIKQQVNGSRNLLLYELGLATALRPSDLLNLCVKDVKEGMVKGKSSKKKKTSFVKPKKAIRKTSL